MYPPLPDGLVPTGDCAVAAAVPEPQLRAALEAAGVPLMAVKVANRWHYFVAKSSFDRWFLDSIKPTAGGAK